MYNPKTLKHASTMIRLRQRLRMVGSAMLSVDPIIVTKMPLTLIQIFTAIDLLNKEIEDIDKELVLSGGGGD